MAAGMIPRARASPGGELLELLEANSLNPEH